MLDCARIFARRCNFGCISKIMLKFCDRFLRAGKFRLTDRAIHNLVIRARRRASCGLLVLPNGLARRMLKLCDRFLRAGKFRLAHGAIHDFLIRARLGASRSLLVLPNGLARRMLKLCDRFLRAGKFGLAHGAIDDLIIRTRLGTRRGLLVLPNGLARRMCDRGNSYLRAGKFGLAHGAIHDFLIRARRRASCGLLVLANSLARRMLKFCNRFFRTAQLFLAHGAIDDFVIRTRLGTRRRLLVLPNGLARRMPLWLDGLRPGLIAARTGNRPFPRRGTGRLFRHRALVPIVAERVDIAVGVVLPIRLTGVSRIPPLGAGGRRHDVDILVHVLFLFAGRRKTADSEHEKTHEKHAKTTLLHVFPLYIDFDYIHYNAVFPKRQGGSKCSPLNLLVRIHLI